eukprot:5791726-Amphidinium_carterae.1
MLMSSSNALELIDVVEDVEVLLEVDVVDVVVHNVNLVLATFMEVDVGASSGGMLLVPVEVDKANVDLVLEVLMEVGVEVHVSTVDGVELLVL